MATFSANIDEATAQITPAILTAVRTAFTDFETALATELTTHGTGSMEKQQIQARIIDLARDVGAILKDEA